jgi:hypothetical protein
MTSGTHVNLIVKSTDEDWYRIHVPSSGQLSVTLAFAHANGDVDLRLYSACGGALLASSNGAVDGESVTWSNPGAAQDVYWRVYLYSDTRNAYSMSVSLPAGIANDACLGAIPLISIANGSTVGATNSVAGSCGQSATSPDVWYAYVASSTGMLSLSTCGSSFDTVVSAYDSCGGTELGCNDDAALGAPCGVNTVQSYLSLPATAGAAFVIRVSGFNGATGNFTLRAENASGVAFCLGDGFSAAQCPCANNSAASAVAGCVGSLGTPGKLIATGVPRISADSIVLRASGMPDSSCLYFQGDARQSDGLGVELGDGLRCAGGLAIRLGAKTNQGGASTFPALLGGDPPVHVKGLIPAAGATRFYQVWYRNSAEFCTDSTFNLTNGYQLTWLP